MHDHAGRLIEREQLIILVQDIERYVFRGHRGPGRGRRERDRHDIAGGGARGGAVDGHAIHGDVPVFNPRLDLRARCRADVGKMPAEHEVQAQARVAAVGGQRAKC